MIKGIGVDMVCITEMERLLDLGSGKGAFERRTFTQAEQDIASNKHNKAEYYATRFASKEAVTKAIAPLCPKAGYDLRIVETLNREDGSPYVNITEPLASVLKAIQVDTIHVSITTEGDYATAFAVACQEKGPEKERC